MGSGADAVKRLDQAKGGGGGEVLKVHESFVEFDFHLVYTKTKWSSEP